MFFEQDLADMVQRQLDRASASGITQPVIALLSEDSSHARALYQEGTGQALPSGDTPIGDDEYGHIALLPRLEAIELVRKHGGKAGPHVAETLADPVLQPAYWLLGMYRESMEVNAIGGRDWKIITGYDKIDKTAKYAASPRQIQKDKGPSSVRIPMGIDGRVGVYGRNGKSATLAADLANSVAAGFVTDASVTVRLTDDILASHLKKHFVRKPAVVMEAITALRRMPGDKDRQLMRVLSRPELKKLAKAVQYELTGEK